LVVGGGELAAPGYDQEAAVTRARAALERVLDDERQADAATTEASTEAAAETTAPPSESDKRSGLKKFFGGRG
jgi:hypothetical protein